MEILCKTGHACTYADTQVSNFYGHVMLGLRIHFLYLSQPNVSKIYSFINLCIHPSPFRVSGKIFTAFTLQVYTHFFQKLVMISDFFPNKSWKSSLFKSMLVFQLNNLFSFSFFLSFSCLLFSFQFISFFSIFIFIMIFVCFI